MATGLPLTHKQSSIIVVVTGQVESGYVSFTHISTQSSKTFGVKV